MASAASKLRAEAGLGALPQRALAQYLRLLRLYPVLTKAATRSARKGRGGNGTGRGAARSSGTPPRRCILCRDLSAKGKMSGCQNDLPKAFS